MPWLADSLTDGASRCMGNCACNCIQSVAALGQGVCGTVTNVGAVAFKLAKKTRKLCMNNYSI